MTREPAIVIGAIVAIVTIIVQQLFPDVSPENQTLILGLVTALAAVIQAILTRSVVTPVADPRDNSGRSLKA